MNNWEKINHGGQKMPQVGQKQKAIFIGRYQPYHYGHILLIEQKLSQGIPALIMVRDIPADDKNPFTTEQTVSCLLYTSPSPRDRQKSRMPSSA